MSEEKKERWFDLSAHGLFLKRMYLPSGNVVHTFKNADDHADKLLMLGFTKHPSGMWFAAKVMNPRDVKRQFDGLKMIDMLPSEFVEDMRSAKPEDLPIKEPPKEKVISIGMNRVGSQIFQDESGVRFIQQKHNRFMETQDTSYGPLHFLRIDETPVSRVGVAEGYLKTLELLKGKPEADLATFAAATGLSVEALTTAVSEAVTKLLLNDKNATSLAARYNNAIAFKKQIADAGIVLSEPHDLLIVARRLMGMDKDLIGESVLSTARNQTLFERLLPARGVVPAENARDASFVIDFAPTAEMAGQMLSVRKLGGTTVLLMDVKTPELAGKMLDLLSKLADVENAAFVTAEAGGPKLIVSAVTVPSPRGTYEMRQVDNAGDLWSWASLVTTTRSHAIEAFKSGLSDEYDLTAAAAYVTQNAQQLPYRSASKVREPTLMTPKELVDPTMVALDRLISTVGDVDAFVAEKYRFDKDKLGDYFSPEQVDGLALTVLATQRNRGMLNADGGGSGKGRWNMACIKREILEGNVCLFLTESGMNLSDIMKDAKHLGMLDMLNVSVLNDGVKVIDEDTGLPFKTVDDAVLRQAINDGVWPAGVNLVVGTFSQFNSLSEQHTRSNWLRNVMKDDAAPRVAFLGDEIHNAATITSNTSQNIAEAISGAVNVYMSSATHAHTSKMVSFYSRLLPPGIDADELRNMMSRGGETFQEVLTSMLVADGVMIRRERNLMNMEFNQSIDMANIERNKERMDQLAVIIYEMAKLNGAIVDYVEAQNRDEDNRRDGVELKSMSIGSHLHHMSRLFDAALMAETVGNAAVQSLKEGGKPVILVDNTIHALLEEGLRLHGGRAPDFKDVLTRILGQQTKLTMIRRDDVQLAPALNAEEQEEAEEALLQAEFDGEAADQVGGALALIPARDQVAVENEEVASAVYRIRALIEKFPDMQASAIDIVKNTLRRAGYSCGEITGRTLEVGEDDIVRPRSDRDRVVTKNGFNSGKIDAIIINSAGSTGIDLHASVRFLDQSQRHYHGLQAPEKVQKELQAINRTSRYDEVISPKYFFHSSGLPYKVKMDSMRNNKLRFASATISGNRDTMLLMQGIPDLINSVGDTVVWNYAQTRPDLIERLCLTKKFFPTTEEKQTVDEIVDRILDVAEGETNSQRGRREDQVGRIEAIRRNSHLANDFLSRLSLLPVAYQEKVLKELGSEYELAIEELNSKGENPLRPRELPGLVHINGEPRLLEGAEDSGVESSFDGPVYLSVVDIERIADPISSEEMMRAVDKGAANYAALRTSVRKMMADRDRYIEPYLKKGSSSVEDAILQNDKSVQYLVQSMSELGEAIEAFEPGREVDFRLPDGDSAKAIIADVTRNSGGVHLQSSYILLLAVPGETQFKTYNLTSFLRDQPVYKVNEKNEKTGGFNVRDGLNGNDYEKVIARFDDATARKRVPARLITGNTFHAVRMAAQARLGQLVSYVDVKGKRHRGILVNKTAEKKIDQINIRIKGIDNVLNALVNATVECNSAPFGGRSAIIITPAGKDEFYLRLPEPDTKRRSAKPKSQAYMELLGRTEEVDTKINRIRLRNEDELRYALDVIADEGITSFYVSAKHKERLDRAMEQGSSFKMAGGMR